MNETRIKIMTQASPGPATDSAQRIAMLIENDLVENGHTTSCIGKLTVRQFEHTEDETEINLTFRGTINGEGFDLTEHHSNAEAKSDVGWALLRSPVVGIILLLFRGLTGTQDHDLSEAEFSLSGKLLGGLYLASSVPVDSEKDNWIPKAAWCSAIAYILIATVLGILTFLRCQDPGDVLGRKGEGLGAQILISLIAGFAFAIPAALGGFFGGLLFWLPKDIENSVHGQSLLRGIGVSSRSGMIAACGFGLAVGVGFSSVLIWFSLPRN